MSRTITAQDAEAVAPGTYYATLDSIGEGNGKFGDYFDWNFDVTGPAGIVEVNRRTSQKMTPNSIARQFVEGLVGHPLAKGEAIDLDSLQGKQCKVAVTTNENGYSTIAAVYPIIATPAAAAGNGTAQTDEAKVLAAAGPGAEFVDAAGEKVPF